MNSPSSNKGNTMRFQFRLEGVDWTDFEIIDADSEEQAWDLLEQLLRWKDPGDEFFRVTDVYRME